MSKRQRPCDFCRSRKTACRIETEPPCRLCQFHNKECTFVEAAQPRKKHHGETLDGHASTHGSATLALDHGLRNAGVMAVDFGVTPRQTASVVVQPASPAQAPESVASPATDTFFPDMSMQFLQDLDIAGPEYQFMFQTPRSPASNVSVVGDTFMPVQTPKFEPPTISSDILLDGTTDLNPEVLGLTGDMDPYLLRRYQADERGTFQFKQLAIHSVQSDPTPTQFLVSQPILFAKSRQEAGHSGPQETELKIELENIVSSVMGKRLIGLYQKFIAPHYPIFLIDALPDPNMAASHLLAAIYCISFPFAMYDDQLCIDLAYDSPPYDALSRIMNTAIAVDIHSPSISTVQTLLLMAARPSSNPLVSDASYRWTILGMLVSAAVNIGLHLDPSSWRIAKQQISQRRRLSFAIFATDRWFAASFGRPPIIDFANWLVSSLRADDELGSGLSSWQWADMLEFSSLTSILSSTLIRLLYVDNPWLDFTAH